MIKSVANVWVAVEDIGRALDFYRDTLGFSVIKQEGPSAAIDANGFNFGLNGREPGGKRAGGGPIVTFQPEAPLEAVVEDLEGKEVEFAAGISEHEWGRVATFKDSEGNDLQLYEPPSG
jgi:catechol 2,3-dioxygenase-like lactoylglutathione lyase family enzyme